MPVVKSAKPLPVKNLVSLFEKNSNANSPSFLKSKIRDKSYSAPSKPNLTFEERLNDGKRCNSETRKEKCTKEKEKIVCSNVDVSSISKNLENVLSKRKKQI